MGFRQCQSQARYMGLASQKGRTHFFEDDRFLRYCQYEVFVSYKKPLCRMGCLDLLVKTKLLFHRIYRLVTLFLPQVLVLQLVLIQAVTAR